MAHARRSSRVLGWIALAALGAAALALIVPVVRFALAAGNDGVAVGHEPVTVHAPAGRTWGIYFNDPDNTGYGESCRIADARGNPVRLRDPGWSVGGDTEMLDHEFTTPSDGTFTVSCEVSRATARVGPVGNLSAVLIGGCLAMVAGLVGLVTGTLWLTRRTSLRPVAARIPSA